MALSKATVPKKPDLACLGVITKVGEANQKEGSLFTSIPIEIKGKAGSPDGRYYFSFQPRWFKSDFDPRVLDAEDAELKAAGKKSGQYFLYCRNIAYANDRKPAALEVILGDTFDAFAAMFAKIDPDDVNAKLIEQSLREVAVGTDVGYVMKQGKDQEGNPSENYNVDTLFRADVDTLKFMEESANSPRRKNPMIVMWNESTPF